MENNYFHGYKLLGEVDSGHFGDVFRMEKDGKLYALKKLKKHMDFNTKQIFQIEREKLLPLNLEHENIIRHIESFTDNNIDFIVSEYFEGKNLKQLIEESKRNKLNISQDKLIIILKQILSGLIYLHERQIAHRDIKPENILINDENKIKIIDFGLSVYLSENEGILSGGKTQVGDKKYVPPEIYYCETNKYDLKGDIHCLGYTMFELMNLNRPTFVDNNTIRINTKIYNNKNIYDEELIELIEEMYKYYVEDRPSAKEAFDRLIAIEHRINNNKNNNNINIIKKVNTEIEDKEIISTMKCVLYCFTKFEDIFSNLDMAIKLIKYQLKNNINIINNKFIKIFYDILNDTLKWQNNEINKKIYEEKIKDFYITLKNRQNNKLHKLSLPLKIFYNIIYIINREYKFYKTKQNSNLEGIFSGILKNARQEPTQKVIEELKLQYKSPLLPYFYFLIIPLTKCYKCTNVFKLFEPEINCFLILDNNKNDNIISDLIYKLFLPEDMNKICKCLNHQSNIIKQKFILTELPRYLIFEIKNKNEQIILNKILNLNSYTTSDEEQNIYEPMAIIYKDQGNNNEVIIKNNDNEWIYYCNDYFTIYNEMPNIYNSVSLVIYKKKNK